MFLLQYCVLIALGKMTCHPGIYSGGGWIIPMAFLLSNGWMRSYGCDSIQAASEYFSKSCVPGALSNEYNPGLPYDNLCHLCRGSSFRYCKRDATEDFYGYTGIVIIKIYDISYNNYQIINLNKICCFLF